MNCGTLCKIILLCDFLNIFFIIVCAKSRSLITLIEKPTCLQNGNYNPMQCRRGKCRCVDKNGNQNKLEVPYENKDDLKCNNT